MKVKQVTKANFSHSLLALKTYIDGADFIAISSQKTGALSSPWRRQLPFDTSEIAYLKAKAAAEKFELLQFAVCPFTVKGSKVVAHPYNFHLFPRDELSIGMPSYVFSCQMPTLESMARKGFDFNMCICEGISYLSRVQESQARIRVRDPIPRVISFDSFSKASVADAIFVERIRSRVRHWKENCVDANKKNDEALVSSLRRIILGSDFYGSRPCLNIDVCSLHQAELVSKEVFEAVLHSGLLVKE